MPPPGGGGRLPRAGVLWRALCCVAALGRGRSGSLPDPVKPSCWSSVFTPDRCCDVEAEESHVYGCWGWENDKQRYLDFKTCCDAEAVAFAARVRRRWNALVSARAPKGSGQEEAAADLGGCQLGWRSAPVHVLRHFYVTSVYPDDVEEPALKIKRLLWRVGRLDQQHLVKDRCGPRSQRRTGRGSRAGSSLSVWLHERLRAAGVRLDGWIINFGAGFASDPMHELARHDPNMSAIFVDPEGTRGVEPPHPGVRFVQEAASPVNLCAVFQQGGLACSPPGSQATPVDFLKIDIDSFECALAKAVLRRARPKAVWIEINAAVPPPVRFARQWDPRAFEVAKTLWPMSRAPSTLGCSISASVALFREEGYGLYASDGLDLVFVRDDMGKHVGGVGVDEFLCYRALLGRGSIAFVGAELLREWIQGSASDVLRSIWCNFSLHDYLLGFDGMPFTLSV